MGCLSSRPRARPTMANTLVNMKMANPLRTIVSKKKKRYTADGFNLDLSYITENLIAMGFPAEKFEACYRNRIDDVVRMLESKHKDHYKIYNLCSERTYDANKFHRRVACYPFKDHTPPKIELIQKFCEDVHAWLTADPLNVAAVHCKAGKGRTGTMICCYMLYSGKFSVATDALNYYSRERTHDLKGVTIPSQRRYVGYCATLLSSQLPREPNCSPTNSIIGYYNPPALHIVELIMQPPPTLNGGQGALEFCVFEGEATSQKVFLGTACEPKKGTNIVRMRLDQINPLVGDIKVEVYNSKPKKIVGKEKLFHFWFNTYFVRDIALMNNEASDNLAPFTIEFDKWQLDEAHKDAQHKLYSPEFKVQLLVQHVPKELVWGNKVTAVGSVQNTSPPSPSNSSPDEDDSESEPDELNEWDSGESTYL